MTKKKNVQPTPASRWLPLLWIGGFAVVAFAVLLLRYDLYMRKVEALSLFLGTASYIKQCMTTPGGLLTWLATYLTQTMYLPWLGALVYALVLATLQFVGAKAMRLPKNVSALSTLPVALVLLAFINLGYLIFSLKPLGFVYTLPLGLLAAMLLVWGSNCFTSWWVRAIACLVVIVAGYQLLGFYALFASLMIAIADVKIKNVLSFVPLIIALVAIWLVPLWWFYHIDGDLIYSQMYITPLPRFYKAEWAWWVLYASIFIVYIAGVLLRGAFAKINAPRLKKMQWATWLVLVAVVVFAGQNDKNLRLTLALDRAIWDQRYDDAVNMALESDIAPTRVNTVLSYIAMMRAGVAGEQMFAIQDSKSAYNTTRAASAFNDIAAALTAYHLGLTNYSYRWSMEYTIGQGMGAERLKLMVKCALLNYELQLARTYLDILYNTTTNREWARKYKRYISNPMEMTNDQELMAVQKLMCNRNEFINDQGAFESYVWPLLANVEHGTPEYDELAMQAALINRDLDSFMARIPAYTRTHQRLPRYYQQAVVLWSMLTKQPAPVAVDQMVEASHQNFLNTFRITSQGKEAAEQQREKMREQFGNTYWFYYVFNDDNLLR